MRNPVSGIIMPLALPLAFSSVAFAQIHEPHQARGEDSKWIYNGRNRVVGSGGVRAGSRFERHLGWASFRGRSA